MWLVLLPCLFIVCTCSLSWCIKRVACVGTLLCYSILAPNLVTVPWHQNLCMVPCLFTSCTLSWYFKLAANLGTQCLVTVDSLCWYPALLLYLACLGTQPCYSVQLAFIVRHLAVCSLFLHCMLLLVPYFVIICTCSLPW